MNANDLQELIASMKASEAGKDLSNQEIYDFLHANNFGSAADQNKQLFGDIKFREEQTQPAAQNNTFGELAGGMLNTASENLGYVAPAALAAAGAAGYALGKKAPEEKTGGSIKDRLLSKVGLQTIPPQVEVPDNSKAVSVAQPAESVTQAPKPVTLSDLEKKLTDAREANVQKSLTAPVIPAAPVAANAPVPPGPIARSPLPQNNPLFSSSPKAPIPPTPTVTETLASGGNPTVAVQDQAAKLIDTTPAPTEVTAKTPKTRAPKTEKFTYKSIPEGHVFIPEMGNLDQALQNMYGEEGRKHARDLLNEGKHFGFAKGNYNKATQELAGKYMQALQGQIPETLLSREERIAQKIPHNGMGNYGKLGKLVTVGGVAGTLLSMSEAAKAAQQGKYGEAAVRAADVATDYIPFVGQLKQGLTPEGANAPGVSENVFNNAALLGSPYAQTEWAKKERLKEKAGAGRGIAPPSAYLR